MAENDGGWVEKGDVRFILSLILILVTSAMCVYAIVKGNVDHLEKIMSTYGVLASAVVAHYFGTKGREG